MTSGAHKSAQLKGDAMFDRNRAQITCPRDRQDSVNVARRTARTIEQIADENRRLNALAEKLRADIAHLAVWPRSVH
jgi:flagellar biosynthesis regulator FlaF